LPIIALSFFLEREYYKSKKIEELMLCKSYS
jgi:hypothetical protein